MLEPEARKFLIEQLKKFLFEDTAEKVSLYQAIDRIKLKHGVDMIKRAKGI